jgi:trk system potassium uptake protein TrkA
MKRFAVIGLGRFGKKLAMALSMSGAEVIAIDKDRDIIEDLRDEVSHAVRLDSTDEDALRAQGVDGSMSPSSAWDSPATPSRPRF